MRSKRLLGSFSYKSHLEIRRQRAVFTAHSMPFDIKDAIGRTAGNRGRDSASVCPGLATGRIRACSTHPIGKDTIVIGAVIGRRRQTCFCVSRRLVVTDKIEPATRVDHHGVEGLVIQNEWEGRLTLCRTRRSDCRCRYSGTIASLRILLCIGKVHLRHGRDDLPRSRQRYWDRRFRFRLTMTDPSGATGEDASRFQRERRQPKKMYSSKKLLSSVFLFMR